MCKTFANIIVCTFYCQIQSLQSWCYNMERYAYLVLVRGMLVNQLINGYIHKMAFFDFHDVISGLYHCFVAGALGGGLVGASIMTAGISGV